MPQNSAKFDFSDLVVIFGEDSLNNINNGDNFFGIGTDSREPIENGIFTALKGEHFDGHENILEALSSGFGASVCSREFFNANPELNSKKIILVDDTLKALGDLAAYHRLRFNIPIVAVAGSNGKTSTKEMIGAILERKFRTLKTYANFNNLVGVPRMLLQLNENFDAAVIELGTNAPGEIYRLGEITKPTHALITNIGKEHLELLIDIDGVEMEETSVFAHLMPGGTVFINRDDDRLKFYGHVIENFVTYSSREEDAQVYAQISFNESLKPTLNLKFEDELLEINLNTYGFESALNALAAAAVGLNMELGAGIIKDGLESFIPLEGNGYARMKAFKHNEITIINDCYNANPSSMASALNNLNILKSTGSKIAVLGDMLELGDSEEEEHNEILRFAAGICNHVLLFGRRFSAASEKADYKNVKSFEFKTELAEYLLTTAKPEDAILFKGSRGMKIEDIIEIFTKS